MADGFILLMGFVLVFSFISAYSMLDNKDNKGSLLKSFFISLALFSIILLFLIIN